MARGSTALEGHSWHQERQSCTQGFSKSGRGQEAEGRQEAGGGRGQGNHLSPRPPLHPTGTASPPAPPRHASSAWAASPPQLTHEDGAVVGVGRRVQPLTSREPVSWGEGRKEAGGRRREGAGQSPLATPTASPHGHCLSSCTSSARFFSVGCFTTSKGWRGKTASGR